MLPLPSIHPETVPGHPAYLGEEVVPRLGVRGERPKDTPTRHEGESWDQLPQLASRPGERDVLYMGVAEFLISPHQLVMTHRRLPRLTQYRMRLAVPAGRVEVEGFDRGCSRVWDITTGRNGPKSM